MPHIYQKRPDTRLQIIQLAAKLFIEEGYSNTSFSKIAKTLDLSTGNITFYFKSKEYLLAQLVAELVDFQRLLIEQAALAQQFRRLDLQHIKILIHAVEQNQNEHQHQRAHQVGETEPEAAVALTVSVSSALSVTHYCAPPPIRSSALFSICCVSFIYSISWFICSAYCAEASPMVCGTSAMPAPMASMTFCMRSTD